MTDADAANDQKCATDPGPAREIVAVEPPPLVLPRGLIMLAFLWLVGSWIVGLGLQTPIFPSPATFEPGVRMMLLSITLGLMVGWPLLRLSQTPSAWPIRQTILDLIVLLAMTQVILWPLRLVTTWSLSRTAAMDATIGAWAALAGGMVAAAIGTARFGPRIIAMASCLGMCLLGPGAAWLGITLGLPDAAELIALSPLLAVHTLAGAGSSALPEHVWPLITLLWAAAGLGWAAIIIWSLAAARRRARLAS